MKDAFLHYHRQYVLFFLLGLSCFYFQGSAHAKPKVLYDGYLIINTIPYTPPAKADFIPEIRVEKEKTYVEDDTGQLRRVVNTHKEGVLSYLGTGMREYQIYLPQDYDENKRYPVVMLLHDANQTGVSLVEKWKATADRAGIILIGPSSLSLEWLIEPGTGDIIEAVLEDAKSQYPIHEDRVFLFGYGQGGALASYVPLYKPELFAAVAVHQGGASEKNITEGLENVSPKTPIAFFGNMKEERTMRNLTKTAQYFARWRFPTQFYGFEKPDNWYYNNADDINLEVMRYLASHKISNKK